MYEVYQAILPGTLKFPGASQRSTRRQLVINVFVILAYIMLLSVTLLYHIAWGRLSNQFLSDCLSVCLYVYVACVCLWTRLRSHFSTNLHEIWQEPLGSEKEELVRLGSKSENAKIQRTAVNLDFDFGP